ncbi:hypothetical protein LJC58_07670 [Lachnospiraceae bacterium OttesenSCG-928-D06]|nr:hypothetical protein [Lachnospiraceae bacterium OttesenSCG-928-D06]
MKKKLKYIVLISVLILTLVACNDNQNVESGNNNIYENIGKTEQVIKDNELDENELINTSNALISDIENLVEPSRVFDSFLDFTYDDFLFADAKTYDLAQKLFDSTNFQGEFKKGDSTRYEEFKIKFLNLLESKEKFYVSNMQEEYYLNTFFKDSIDIFNCKYYYFDINDDNLPELSLIANNTVYVFGYNDENNKLFLWKEISPSWYQLIGSSKMTWNRGGISHVFYQLDENGEEEFSVHFHSTEKPDINGEAVEYFLVALPNHLISKEMISEELVKQIYYSRSYNLLYIRVTEEQYQSITKNYFNSYDHANKCINQVTFNFNELFDELANN